jgi:hypothetical protein
MPPGGECLGHIEVATPMRRHVAENPAQVDSSFGHTDKPTNCTSLDVRQP